MHDYPTGHPNPLPESERVLQAGVSLQSPNNGVTQALKPKGTGVMVIPTGTALPCPDTLHLRVPTSSDPTFCVAIKATRH